MEQYVTGSVIRTLREKKGLTQRQLAERLSVSDKTVSKWETGKGLPDISLLEPLAAQLGVSVAELLRGEWVENRNRGGSVPRASFYVCPVCGNVVYALGKGSYSCCGITLPPLEAEAPDEAHALNQQWLDGELYVTLAHPMEKNHFVSFAALVSFDRVQLVKLYPEQEPAVRFAGVRPGDRILVCCNRHGLFAEKAARRPETH